MTLFEIKVETVSSDWGRHTGYKTIGYTVNKAKAEEVAKAWAEEHTEAGRCWWMSYGKNENDDINVIVEEKGEIIE